MATAITAGQARKRLITLVCEGRALTPQLPESGGGAAWSPGGGGVIPRVKRAEGSRAQLRVALPALEPPRDAQMGVPTQVCPQALDTRAHPGCEPFTAPSGSSLEGADLRPSHLLGQYAHHVWPDPGVRHDRRPPPQIVPPGTPTPWPSLSPGVSTLPPLSASACLSACLSVCPSPSGCLISTSLWIMKPGVEGTQANLPVSAHGLVDQARARETPRAGWGQLGGRSSRNREGTHSCAWGERVVRLGAGQAGWFLQWRMGIPPEGSGQPAT